jgi:hypothetical protein
MTGDRDDGEVTAAAGNLPDQAVLSPAVIELDHIYEVLSHPRRRYLCYALLEDAVWSLEDLADAIAAWEHTDGPEAPTDQRRSAVYVSLYHAHVPKLVEEDVLLFDESTETVAPGENAHQVLLALRGISTGLDLREGAGPSSETDATPE